MPKTTRAVLAFLVIAIIVLATAVFFLVIQNNSKIVQPDLPFTIKTYDKDAAWQGNITFGAMHLDPNNLDVTYGSTLVIMNTEGKLFYWRQTSGQNYWAIKNLAANTLLFQGEPTTTIGNDPLAATHFWNYLVNQTTNFPDVQSHHDIAYNPVNNTFMTLQPYIRTVGNNTYLYDKIELVNATGGVLWIWDTYNNIPLTEADPFNLTVTVGSQTVIDFTHANALDWDYNNSIIYLNLRHTNTFYKINQSDGSIIWACGQFGNFTLLDENGSSPISLWYHSHDLAQVAPNVFSMFDNDFDNITNPDNCQSRMILVSVNETDMTAKTTWSWTAPKSYWTPYLGSTIILPNGNFMGCFGTPTHQFDQNQPWDFDNSGAVIVEVTPEGKLVRTITFPVGWQIYRVQKIFQ